jgi:hypothetical protein
MAVRRSWNLLVLTLASVGLTWGGLAAAGDIAARAAAGGYSVRL